MNLNWGASERSAPHKAGKSKRGEVQGKIYPRITSDIDSNAFIQPRASRWEGGLFRAGPVGLNFARRSSRVCLRPGGALRVRDIR